MEGGELFNKIRNRKKPFTESGNYLKILISI